MNENTIKVGWIGKPELGSIQCDVIDRWDQPISFGDVKTVQYLKGKLQAVTYLTGFGYTFVPGGRKGLK